MRPFAKRFVLPLALAAAAPLTAQALPPLLSQESIVAPLVEARAADVVRKGCGSYKVNMVRAWKEARALQAQARQMGYSQAQIDAFIEDRQAKDAVKGRANALLASLGADGSQASLCAAGDRLVRQSAVAAKLIRR